MKIGFKIVIYLLLLNLVSGLVYTLNIPGVENKYPTPGTGSTTDYEEQFNATEMMEKQQPGIIAELPFLGNIYGTIMYLWNAIKFIVVGFPLLLYQLGSVLEDEASMQAYNAICGVIGALFSFIIFGWLFQVITGRQTED